MSACATTPAPDGQVSPTLGGATGAPTSQILLHQQAVASAGLHLGNPAGGGLLGPTSLGSDALGPDDFTNGDLVHAPKGSKAAKELAKFNRDEATRQAAGKDAADDVASEGDKFNSSEDADQATDYSLTGNLAAPSSISLKAPDISHFQQVGRASWYGKDFHGRRTASGERFDMNAMTAAHPTLPLASYVQVTNTQNDKSVIVKINDRGPYHGHRIIDLSRAAAKAIGMAFGGTGKVAIKGLSPQEAKAARDDMLAGR